MTGDYARFPLWIAPEILSSFPHRNPLGIKTTRTYSKVMPPIVIAQGGGGGKGDSTTKHGEYHHDAVYLAPNPSADLLPAAD